MLRSASRKLLSSSRRTFSQQQEGSHNKSHFYHGKRALNWNGLDAIVSASNNNGRRREEDCAGRSRGLHTYASPLMQNHSLLHHHPNRNNKNAMNRNLQTRNFTEILPEAMQSFTIWGASGWLLKTIHMDGAVPYWACFSMINILVRLTLFPLVLYSAHTAAKFGKVAAEIQFFVSMFQNDYKQTKARGASRRELFALLRMGLESLRGVYKLHNINPLAALLSPLLQIPFFVYMSVDLRKIVNGRDPELAQELTDCPSQVLAWVPDLTEPDPYYILPMVAGAFMYANVETAIGKKNLAGDAAAKADMSLMLKDLFQSVAIFMPCFASHNPAGMQIYLCTSFVYTTMQGYALRNEEFRSWVGLPSRNRPPEEPKYGMTFIQLKELERKAEEIRGDGPILGEFIMAQGWRLGMPGTKRESTIEIPAGQQQITKKKRHDPKDDEVFNIIEFFTTKPDTQLTMDPNVTFVHGVSAPLDEMVERMEQARLEKEQEKQQAALVEAYQQGEQQQQQQHDYTDEIMEKANRGERPLPTLFASKDSAPNKQPTKLNPKRFSKLARKTKKGKKSKR